MEEIDLNPQRPMRESEAKFLAEVQRARMKVEIIDLTPPVSVDGFEQAERLLKLISNISASRNEPRYIKPVCPCFKCGDLCYSLCGICYDCRAK